MVNVNGIPPVVAPHAVEPISQAASIAQPAETSAVTDSVEISMAAKLAAQVHQLPEVRADLVADVKAQIAAGTYETQERLDVAVQRLLDDLLSG